MNEIKLQLEAVEQCWERYGIYWLRPSMSFGVSFKALKDKRKDKKVWIKELIKNAITKYSSWYRNIRAEYKRRILIANPNSWD